MTSTHKLKKAVREALAAADFERVTQLALDNRKVFGILMSLSFNKEDLICWRAIEAMGIASSRVASERDPELVRNAVRRIIWSAREESGGMGWSAPELLGEIVRGSPRAFTDIPTIILSLHTEDEEGVFLKGVIWALGRMAEAGITGVEGAESLVLDSLASTDPRARGLAAWAAGKLEISRAVEDLRGLEDDQAEFSIYRERELVRTTVGREASAALAILGGGSL